MYFRAGVDNDYVEKIKAELEGLTVKRSKERFVLLKDIIFAVIVVPWWGLRMMLEDHFKNK